MTAKQTVTIIVSTIFQDAGDATRAIEIARGIKTYSPSGVDPRVIFLSHGSLFEQRALDQGFEVYHAEPAADGIGERHDYKMTMNNFIGDKHLAKALIEGEVMAYKAIKPDVVVFGFWPMAGLAYRMMQRNILGICFVPVPCTTEHYLETIPDIPEHVPFFHFSPSQQEGGSCGASHYLLEEESLLCGSQISCGRRADLDGKEKLLIFLICLRRI